MPELPEVETVRRGLVPAMEGERIAHAHVARDGLRWPFPERMAERLTGARILQIGRRGKYLLTGLDTGETLLIHLGMSGRVLVSGGLLGGFHQGQPTARKHDHVVFDMASDVRVVFNDARRFGIMDLAPTEELAAHRLLRDLGPEPLGNAFSEARLASRFGGRTAPVKALLLDQTIVAGIGNIYASEALHRAGIAPLRAAGSLSPAELARLVSAIRDVLAEAIAAGGSSLRDHRQTNGAPGGFQNAFRAYGREGEACLTPGCGGAIRRIVQAGRATFWCPGCQR